MIYFLIIYLSLSRISSPILQKFLMDVSTLHFRVRIRWHDEFYSHQAIEFKEVLSLFSLSWHFIGNTFCFVTTLPLQKDFKYVKIREAKAVIKYKTLKLFIST